ncbi:hypothetical protein JQ559_01040 [Bradyrhizobium viridifuturi]|jgi:hypothetical protein|nr:hypothetical protein [Bradyrhizobium viridifuturi]ERF85435.1 MAG: hypothetical protein C207_01172 [Bradyrhizobium sp. DFCI-1]MCA3792641.1 hypothetical protein [Burkholderia sp.]QRI67814.1 hypothetical protein JQ507_22965 [Bradyrhizobium sp. PSBB068]MBR1018451.1 hypothetical protein [Bradyrhizobium viridifuturi]MBR1039139.1 hypothetical protein [Bradyrhizobium viridifuturi]
MAAFLDTCRFSPSTGGTTDWLVAGPVGGYLAPAAAGAVNGRTYKYRAESADLSQWELGEGTWNASTGVLSRTTILFNSSGTTSKINFTVSPQVAIVALREDLISIEEANNFTAAQRAQARTNIRANPSESGVFIVDRNGTDQTGLTAAAYNKITWTNKPVDNETWFDTSTGRYTPQTAGTYLFVLDCSTATGTSLTESCQPSLYKNGARIKNGAYTAVSNGMSADANKLLVCAVPMNGSTDYVEAYVYLPNGVTTLFGAAASTHFQGFRIGA